MIQPRRGRRLLPLALLLLALLGASASAAQAAIAGAYLVRVNGQEAEHFRVDTPLPPASLTKMLTALLVLERADMEAVTTVSARAAQATGTRLGVTAGQRFRVRELLLATVLKSANDACRALAEHVGGSEDGFVALMNRRAAELSMQRTHFVNACGHDHPQHLSTAADLAILAERVMDEPRYAEIAAMVKTRVSTLDGSRSFALENKNELIGRYPGAIGVKTGFTPKAGKCLVALVQRQDKRVLLVMLNAKERWWTAVGLLDEVFARISPAQ